MADGRPDAAPDAPEGADARTAELIATVSHEIRAPLTTIKGFTKTLLDRWDKLGDEAKLDLLRAVNADADRVTRLIGELLDLSRIEAGRLTLHPTRFDLRELAGEVVAAFTARSGAHTVVLVEGARVEVLADQDKIRQVLNNFLENALKYTERGAVRVSCAADGTVGRVSVVDEGEGVPAEQIPGMFEKFSRRDGRPGAPTGTGLGLYICKGLVEAHGGSIGADSVVGQGSTFWFTVPLDGPR